MGIQKKRTPAMCSLQGSRWQQAVAAARPSLLKEEIALQRFLQAAQHSAVEKILSGHYLIGHIDFALMGMDYLPGRGLLLSALRRKGSIYSSLTRLAA